MRSNITATDEIVRRALADHLADGVDAPANYSLVLETGEQQRGRPRGLHLLYRSSEQVIRSRAASRVLQGLFSYLSDHVNDGAPGLLRTSAVGAVVNGGAILVPRFTVMSVLKDLQPRLHGLGIQLVDAPVSLVDPHTAELVVPDPVLRVVWSAVQELSADERLGPELPRIEAGRFPLRAWAFTLAPDQVGPVSRARAVAAAFESVDGEQVAQEALENLAAVFTRAAGYAIWPAEPEEFARRLYAVGTSVTA